MTTDKMLMGLGLFSGVYFASTGRIVHAAGPHAIDVPSNLYEQYVPMILTILTQAVIILGFIVMIFILFKEAFGADSGAERTIRVSALFTGLLVYLGAQSMGISISDFLDRALSVGSPIKFGLIGFVVPGLVGLLAGSVLTAAVRSNSEVAIRLLMFFGMIGVALYADVYIAAVSASGLKTSVLLAPNIVFIVGMVLYVMLRYRSTVPGSA